MYIQAVLLLDRSYASKSSTLRTYVKPADPLETRKVHKVTELENPNMGFATDTK